MAGERLASAARMVARIPSRLYFVEDSVGHYMEDKRKRLTQQTPAMPYLPFAAFSSMTLALLSRRSSFGFLDAGWSAIVTAVKDGKGCNGTSEESTNVIRSESIAC